MNEKQQKDLSDLFLSNGWLILEQSFKDRIKSLDSLSSIDDTLSTDLQAVQIKANKTAINILEGLLSEVQKSANIEIRKTKSFL
jgi:hypothetical protein